jgi:hypothetical protein
MPEWKNRQFYYDYLDSEFCSDFLLLLIEEIFHVATNQQQFSNETNKTNDIITRSLKVEGVENFLLRSL